jgi:hypothetical protein
MLMQRTLMTQRTWYRSVLDAMQNGSMRGGG